MSRKEPHYAVEFAKRYSAPTDLYLTAWIARCRLFDLIEDAKSLKEYLDIAVKEEERWAPWFGSEIISYYAVGFVTCLEWHARSRLVDLLSFDPKSAKPEDLKVVRDRVVLEMIAENVTIAYIVGASTNVSNLDEYLNIFTRVLSAFGENYNGFAALKENQGDGGQPYIADHEISELTELFRFRNNLVHEIGIQRVGHRNIRDCWGPEEVIRIGELTLRLMNTIELQVNVRTPASFPNRWAEDGFPTSDIERLMREIGELEIRIENFSTDFLDGDNQNENYWNVAKQAASHYVEKESQFIDQALIFHNRYVGMRDPLKLSLVKSRHRYLTDIIRIVGGVWKIKESPVGSNIGD